MEEGEDLVAGPVCVAWVKVKMGQGIIDQGVDAGVYLGQLIIHCSASIMLVRVWFG